MTKAIMLKIIEKALSPESSESDPSDGSTGVGAVHAVIVQLPNYTNGVYSV